MTVAVRCETRDGLPFVRALRSSARWLLAERGLEDWELSLVLTDDEQIRVLNRNFRRKDRATDVLSFPQLDAVAAARLRRRTPPKPPRTGAPKRPLEPAQKLLGDVVISVATARRQAQAADITPAQRIRTLLVHGCLHLLGYDHERSAAQARAMRAEERRLIAGLEAARPGLRKARRHAVPSGLVTNSAAGALALTTLS